MSVMLPGDLVFVLNLDARRGVTRIPEVDPGYPH